MDIVPILNKIDLPASDCDRVAEQIEDVIGIDASGAIQVSAKTGVGIKANIRSPSSKNCLRQKERAMPRSRRCWWTVGYDAYLGVIVLVRIMDGVLKKSERIKMLSNGLSASRRQDRCDSAPRCK